VRVGIDKRSAVPTDSCVQTREVVARVNHPSYSPSTLEHDISLLQLNAPVDYAAVSSLATLDDPLTAAGTPLTVAGWGTTSSGGTLSDAAMEVTVPAVSNAQCAAAYGAGQISDGMLCAGTPAGGKDSCQGDSGGPLFGIQADSSLVYVGIVSWGRGCALAQYPGVYTRVGSERPWICTTATIGCDGASPPPASAAPPSTAPAPLAGSPPLSPSTPPPPSPATPLPPPPLPAIPATGVLVLEGGRDGDVTFCLRPGMEAVTSVDVAGATTAMRHPTIAAQCCEPTGECRRFVGQGMNGACSHTAHTPVTPTGAHRQTRSSPTPLIAHRAEAHRLSPSRRRATCAKRRASRAARHMPHRCAPPPHIPHPPPQHTHAHPRVLATSLQTTLASLASRQTRRRSSRR